MKRESFVFYRSFFEAIRKLNKRDQATIYSQICRYALDGEIDELTGVPAAIFDLIKPQIDANLRRYENGTKGGEYGKLGGRPKTPKEPLKNPKQTPNANVNVNENVNVNDNENVNVNVSGSENTDADNTHTERVFENKPTQKELADEIVKEDYRMSYSSVEGFLKYNEEREWPMPWRDALKRWNELQRDQKQKTFVNKFQNFPRNHDNDKYREQIIAQSIGGNL